MLKVAFHFGNTHRTEDLRALLEQFKRVFRFKNLRDQETWQLFIRGWAILGKEDKVIKYVEQARKRVRDKLAFDENTLISLAMVNCDSKVEEILARLKENNTLSNYTLERLLRTFAYDGNIEKTFRLKAMCDELYPGSTDKTMLLMAHKVALSQIIDRYAASRGSKGLNLKPNVCAEVDQLHASWENLTKDMFNGPVDITDCNLVLEYLTLANRLDPVSYPMEKAEYIFDSYMQKHNVQPNEVSYHLMMQGYATTRQYNTEGKRSKRLDKALEVLSKMQSTHINNLNHRTFHILFRACIPHAHGHYYFDNFKLASLLPSHAQHPLPLDPRLFDIEQIMLEARLPHDRFTFATLLTCLAASGKFKAFNDRWNSLKLHNRSPDIGLYRHAFALSALNPEQSKRAIRNIKPDMELDVASSKIDFGTYCALLDCCSTAQLQKEAQEIMGEIKDVLKTNRIKGRKGQWPDENSPEVYSALLRAATLIKGMNADNIIQEMNAKGIEYNEDIWEILLSKHAAESDIKGVRRLFNQYTMYRHEKAGKIPIPVRETSPVVPFPGPPYNRLDTKFIEVYLSSLLDLQDVSLVFDVLRTWSEQTPKLPISRPLLEGIIELAKEEKAKAELKWLSNDVLSKATCQTRYMKRLHDHVNSIIQN
ncbi:hypothetical protein RMCBS344292_05589 [Rhizopus microsporus]|nr:hypothetical protein RMCBS344292_05589 [Rhizopus microsporus]